MKKSKDMRSLVALMGGASIAVLGMMVPAISMAQTTAGTTTAAAPTPDSTVVVVTGIRNQLKTSQKIKKDSNQIVDSITAVDIGALPDKTVADALQRISGISITRASTPNDPIRMTAEAGEVLIRGMTFTRSETNEHDIYSAENGRSLSWGDVSADLLAGVDVYKNPSADMIEGGLAGTIDLRTLMPFDQKKDVIAFSVDDSYGDLQKKNKPSIDGLISKRFDTGAGEIGVLLDVSWSNEGNQTDAISLDRLVQVPTNTNDWVPNTIGYRTVDWNQERRAENFAVQWKPNDDTQLFFRVFDSRAIIKNLEYDNQIGDFSEITTGAEASNSNYKYNSAGDFVSGTIPSNSLYTDTRYEINHNETTDFTAGGSWRVNDKLTLNGDVQFLTSYHDMTSMTVFLFDPTDLPNINVNLNGKLPVLTYATPNTAILGNWYLSNAMDHEEKSHADGIAAKLDAKYQVSDTGFIRDFKFGVRATDKKYLDESTNYNWGTLGEYASDPTYVTGSDAFVDTFSNFMHGSGFAATPVVMANPSLVNVSPQASYQLLKATETTGWGAWVPNADNGSNWDGGSGYVNIREKTQAAYVVADFAKDVTAFGGDRTIDGNIGVRVVRTDTVANGFMSISPPTTPAGGTTCSSTPTSWCTDLASFAAISAGTYPVDGSRTYSTALPSLNVRFKYNDQWQFRFAAAQALHRPDYSQLGAYGSLSANFATTPVTNGAYTVTSESFTGTTGNPYLKPMLSTNFDATAEWYFSSTGSLTLDLFSKNVRDYITEFTDEVPFSIDGKTETFDVVTYENTAKAKAQGLELVYKQAYDALPGFWSGFGTQETWTHVDSHGGANSPNDVTNSNDVTGANLSNLPWEQISKDTYNVEAFYEKYGYSARLAYNWRSSFLLTADAANVDRPIWSGAYGQLDGSFTYTINDHYKIGLQATNLLKANTNLRVSSNLATPLSTQFYAAIATDQRISAFFRAKF